MSELTLMIPGPTWVRPEVLEHCNQLPWGHRDTENTPLRIAPAKKYLKQMLCIEDTEYDVIISTSSGAGLLEAAIINCVLPDEKVLNVSVGAFGDLWYKIVKSNGRDSEYLTFDPGTHADPAAIKDALEKDKFAAVCVTMNETSTGVENPIAEIGKIVKDAGALYFVDAVSCMAGVPIKAQEWSIDMVVASSQKAFGLPPGISVAGISPAAFAKAEQNPCRGAYFDLLSFRKSIVKDQTPNTPATNLIDALAFQLDYIVNTEGIENRYARHKKLAGIVREWIPTLGGDFSLLPDPAYASNTITCVKHAEDLDKAAIKQELRTRGYLYDAGYRALAKKGLHTFRVPTLGDITESMLQTYLQTLTEVLAK
jgi:predicted phosphoserine aminotransferase